MVSYYAMLNGHDKLSSISDTPNSISSNGRAKVQSSLENVQIGEQHADDPMILTANAVCAGSPGSDHLQRGLAQRQAMRP